MKIESAPPSRLRIGMSCIALGRILRGGELLMAQLASHLSDRGHDVTVYQSGPALAAARFRTVVLPVPFQFYDLAVPPLALSLRSLRRRMARWQALGSIWGFAIGAHAAALHRRHDVFVVQHAHPEALLQKLQQRLRGTRTVALGSGPLITDALMICADLDAFVATSPPQASWARYFHSAPVTLLPLGVDLVRFHPEGPEAPEMARLPRPRVVACGALIPLKRVSLAIAALARLGRGSLVVLGDGPERAALERMGRELLPGRVLFAGAVPHADLPGFYRAADALAFPSASAETGGQVILEALACGTPVVATSDETRRWLVGEGGLTVAVEDAERFAGALADATQGDLRVPARRQAERFGYDRMAAGFESLSYDLQEGRPVRPSYGAGGAA